MQHTLKQKLFTDQAWQPSAADKLKEWWVGAYRIDCVWALLGKPKKLRASRAGPSEGGQSHQRPCFTFFAKVETKPQGFSGKKPFWPPNSITSLSLLPAGKRWPSADDRKGVAAQHAEISELSSCKQSDPRLNILWGLPLLLWLWANLHLGGGRSTKNRWLGESQGVALRTYCVVPGYDLSRPQLFKECPQTHYAFQPLKKGSWKNTLCCICSPCCSSAPHTCKDGAVHLGFKPRVDLG